MTGHFATEVIDLGNMSNNNVPQAWVGDIIVYDWSGDGSNDHVAMVVGGSATNSQYPEVSEWSNVNWGLNNRIDNPSSDQQKRGWTWSAMSKKWLSEVHPGTTDKLIHFKGDYTIPSY